MPCQLLDPSRSGVSRRLSFRLGVRREAFAVFERAVALATRVRLGRRVPALRTVYFLLRSRLQPERFQVDGLWLKVHRTDTALTHALLSSGRFEPEVSACLDRALRPGDVLLDVGANVGYHTLRGAVAVGSSGRVIAVEPERDNLRLLLENLATNGITNVTTIPVAAGSVAARLDLYVSETNHGDHRLTPVDGRTKIVVAVERLDDVLAGVLPDVVKIDVQGWELEVLKGLASTLHRAKRCVLVTELWSDGLVAAGAPPPEYLAFLHALGFELFDLVHAGRPAAVEPSYDVSSRDTNLLGLKGLSAEDRAMLLAPHTS